MRPRLRLGFALLASALLWLMAGPAFGGWDANLKIFIPSQGQVVLYDSTACRGEPYVVLQVPRDYPDFRNVPTTGGGNWNDRASCVHVGPNTRLIVYQNINYGGSTKTYTAGYYGLCGDWWDNTFSSARAR